MAAKNPIDVRIVWHPEDLEEAAGPRALPEQLFSILQGDPTLPAGEHLHIPVSFHTGRPDARGRWGLPVDVPLDRADQVVVVALVGDALVEDARWFDWLAAQRRRVGQAGGDRAELLGICLTERASRPTRLWGEVLAERAFTWDDDPVERDRFVRITVLRTIARRLLGDQRLTVFVSHAQVDGAAHAERLVSFVRNFRGLGLIDVEQIEGGQNIREVLGRALDGYTVMVAVVSDAYARRTWCRWEALLAKQRGLPTVVLDIVTESQQRSLPFLGNTPVVRCNVPGDEHERRAHAASASARVAYARTLEAGTAELIRSAIFPRQVALLTTRLGLEPGRWMALPSPPELLSLMTRRAELQEHGGGVYPDPPVPTVEQELLATAVDPARLTTRMRLSAELAGSADGARRQLQVGISISQADTASLHRHALGAIHLDALFMELCTHLLAMGHVLAYGGDPLKNFTLALRDLDLAYGSGQPDQPKRLRNYIARFLSEAAEFRRADFLDAMDLIDVGRDMDAGEPEVVRPVLDLTAMRRRMTAEIDVRVAAGGNPKPGEPGTRRGPGVVEEAFLALRAGVPLLVIGGFGGAAGLIADALRGELPSDAADDLAGFFAPMASLLADTAEPYTIREMLAAFEPETDLRNGLSVEENTTLLTTEDIETAVALVLRSVQRQTPSES